MTTTQAIPPPYSGQNDQYPIISVQNPYCERMINFNNLQGVVKLRKGNDKFAEVTSGIACFPLNIAAYNTQLFTVVSPLGPLEWYNITSGTQSLAHTGPGLGGDDEINTLYYNGFLLYFGEASLTAAPQYYKASTGLFGATPVAWTGMDRPFGGDVYKNRAYMITYGKAQYQYTGIDVVADVASAVTIVDLSSVISEPGRLFIIRPISLTQNLTPETVQAFIFETGEVLVYSGSYPNASNWGLASRFTISKVPYMHYYVDAKGDSFLLTESEILSLRNLYVSGYDYEKQNGIGRAIKNRWSAIIKALIANGYHIFVHGVYDKSKDRIIISLPTWLDPLTGTEYFYPSQLIYDFTLGAWYEYYQTTAGEFPIVSATYFDDEAYLFGYSATKGVAMRLDTETNFVDQDPSDGAATAITYRLRSAPLPMPKFGANSIDGVEVICKSDLYPQTNYKFIGDLGRQETTTQNLPAQGTSIAKPMMNVGIQGTITTQFEITGATVSSAVGLELYAFNTWYTAGDKGSR